MADAHLQPKTFSEFIDAVRAELVCDRCGRYVGSMDAERYKPAPYPVALGKIDADHEAEALVGFEWHMVGLLRQTAFAVRHPEHDGRCVSFREWAAANASEDEDEDDDASEAAPRSSSG